MSDERPRGSQDRRTVTGALSTWGEDAGRPAETVPIRSLGRYTDLELIGHGGMGSVYKAWDPRLSRTVALKLLVRQDPQAKARFLREARSQAQISHPNVCEIFEVGEVGELPFIAMRHIDGFSLAVSQENLTRGDKVRVIRDVARAVHAAHEKGLVHRDVKPSNVMLETKDGGSVTPVVVDFGLSRSMIGAPASQPERDDSTEAGPPDASSDLTRAGDIAGTPAYMAPEQALGLHDRLDARTDVYAIGCTLYQLLAGRPPLVANSAMSLLLMATSQTPRPLRELSSDVPPDLDAVVMRCLEKDAADRYQTAAELAADLDRFLEHRPVEAYAGGALYPLGKWIRRQPVLLGLLVVLLGGAAAATVSWIHNRLEIRRQAEAAQLFGQEVARLESFLWKVRSLPPHDTSPHNRVVRERLEGLEQRLADSRGAARGPGAFALGSAYATLGDLTAARAHLDDAWQLGYREPEVAYALGRMLSQLYQQGLVRLETIAEEEIRRTERRRLETELRDRARFFLELGEGATLEAPELVSGLIALCEDRYHEAVVAARASFNAKPWIHEAKLLEGDALAAEALEQVEDDQLLDLSAARAAFDQAVQVAPSDPRCRLRIAGLHLRRLGRANEVEHRKISDSERSKAVADAEMVVEVARDLPAAHAMLAEILTAAAMNGRAFESAKPVELFDRALSEVGVALELAPADPSILAVAGRVSAWRAVDAMRWGGVDDEALELLLERAISCLKGAVEQQPTYDNLNMLGVAARRRGLWKGMRGRDCVEDFKTAAANFKAATKRFPEGLHALYNLASVLHAQAFFAAPGIAQRVALLEESVAAFVQIEERYPKDAEVCYSKGQAEADLASAVDERGGDPLPLFDRSIASFERAVEIFPDFSQAQRAAGYGLVLKAEYLLDHGSDPTPALARAETWLEAACEHEGFASPWVTLGGLYRVRARYQAMTGGDPLADLAASAAAYDRSLEIRSGRPDVFVGRAQTGLVHARHLVESEADPSRALATARADLSRAEELNPTQWQLQALRAEADVLEIQWRMLNERDLGDLVSTARQALESEAENNPSDLLRHLVAGELALCSAHRRATRDEPPASDVADGLASLAQALAADRSSARAHLLAGRLHLFAAEHGTDTAQEHLEQAVTHLATALEINPLLESRYGEDLRRAQRLLNG